MRISLRRPSGVQRGTKKQDSPFGDCAVTRKASHIGADKNHLWPTMRQEPSFRGSARVVLARTSEPPCFSVSPMPISTPRFCAEGMKRRSYSRESSSGIQSRAICGTCLSTGTAP